MSLDPSTFDLSAVLATLPEWVRHYVKCLLLLQDGCTPWSIEAALAPPVDSTRRTPSKKWIVSFLSRSVKKIQHAVPEEHKLALQSRCSWTVKKPTRNRCKNHDAYGHKLLTNEPRWTSYDLSNTQHLILALAAARMIQGKKYRHSTQEIMVSLEQDFSAANLVLSTTQLHAWRTSVNQYTQPSRKDQTDAQIPETALALVRVADAPDCKESEQVEQEESVENDTLETRCVLFASDQFLGKDFDRTDVAIARRAGARVETCYPSLVVVNAFVCVAEHHVPVQEDVIPVYMELQNRRATVDALKLFHYHMSSFNGIWYDRQTFVSGRCVAKRLEAAS